MAEARRFRIIMFDTKAYDKKYFELQIAASKANVEIRYHRVSLSIDSMELTAGFDAVCIFVHDPCQEDAMARLAENGVKLLLLRCAGHERVDLAAAEKYGITVTNVPDYSPHSVAEFATSLLMCLNRRVHTAFNRVRDGNFSLKGLDGVDIHGKTVGVVGVGKIGCRFVNIMKGFGCSVLCHDPVVNEEYAQMREVTYVGMDRLLRESDIISLHAPLNAETRHLIDKEAIAKMKSSCLLINTSRGELVDTDELVIALKENKLGGAALDVYEGETGYFHEDWSAGVIRDDTLARIQNLRNCLVTSHQAYLTAEALTQIADTTLLSVKEFTEGKRFDQMKNHIRA